MGTRGITRVINKDGQTVVAQYGQWDHYPSGQGINILSFLGSRHDVIKSLETALFKCYWVTDEDLKTMYEGFVNENGMMTMEQSDMFSSMYPSLTRNTCSDILKVVTYSTAKVPLVNEEEFINDTLFCEGVYTINFKTREFVTEYGGHTVSFPLDNLPTKYDYINAFEKEEVNA